MGKTFGGAVAAIAFMVLGAPSASAATTVGQTAPNSASVAGLGGPTLIVQDQIAGSPARRAGA